MSTFQQWLDKKDLDVILRKELVEQTHKDREDAFYTNIAFGTAGMRGLLGAGPNRMNYYTVGRANLGFAKYILEQDSKHPKVAIAYDNRHMSKEFAKRCANQLSSLGVEVYVFDELRATPELSFAIRHLKCTGGIVITASHNPKEYNGYKVYDETGCQLTPDKIDRVIELINELPSELDVPFDDGSPELIHWINQEVDIPYMEAVKSIQLRPDLDKSNLKIVFSPQHGTSYPLLPQLFEECGYDVTLVKEQCSPDPDFSNTKSPNPEEKVAYEKAIELAKEIGADLVLTTDPDADRMGMVVKHNDEYILLSGNQGGVVLLEYILSTRQELGTLPKNGTIFNTVVTSDSGEAVAKSYGVKTEKTLTGFKYIGQKVRQIEEGKDQTYLFGYEESYGYMIEPFVRDKDAFQACLMVAEAAAYYQSQNKTLLDVLNDVYGKIGFFNEEQVALTLKGEEGSARIIQLLKTFREWNPDKIANVGVMYFEDFLAQRHYEHDRSFMMSFPAENVLKFGLEDGSWIAIRPSGTEPKCKFYYCIKAHSQQQSEQRMANYKVAIQEIIDKV